MQPSTLPIDFSFRLTLAFAPFQLLPYRRASRLRNKSSILRSLRALILSCRSFCESRLFFSIACRLFVQNTREWVPLGLCLASEHIKLLALCFHGLTNCFSRNSFILTIICVAPRVWGCVLSPTSKNAAVLFDMAEYKRCAIQAILGQHRATIGSRSSCISPLPRAAHSYAPRRHTSQWTHFQASCYQSVRKRHGGPRLLRADQNRGPQPLWRGDRLVLQALRRTGTGHPQRGVPQRDRGPRRRPDRLRG